MLEQIAVTANQAAEVWHIMQHSPKVSPGDISLFGVLFVDVVQGINKLLEVSDVETAVKREKYIDNYQRAKALGVCHLCGKPSRPGRVKCQACANYMQDQKRARRENEKMKSENVKFREMLESCDPDKISILAEFIAAKLEAVEKPTEIECPGCGREFSI